MLLTLEVLPLDADLIYSSVASSSCSCQKEMESLATLIPMRMKNSNTDKSNGDMFDSSLTFFCLFESSIADIVSR